MPHMESNNFFSKHQHGFFTVRSTITQLLEVLDNWFYLDFSKALTQSHTQDSYLSSYDNTGKVISWITEFLNNMKQAVCVNGTVSKWASHVLGPVIYIIYINPLPDHVTNHITLFVYDSKLWAPVKTIEDCEALQNDITQLHEWTDTWQLNFNEKKCTVLRVGKNLPSYTYTMTNHTGQTVKLQETTCEKDLGVWIDNVLSFKHHTSSAFKKINTRSHTKIL